MGLQVECEFGRECAGSWICGESLGGMVEFDFATSDSGQREGFNLALSRNGLMGWVF